MVTFTKFFSKKIALIMTFTDYGKLFAENHFRIPVRCVPLPIDTDFFVATSKKHLSKIPHLIMIARFVPYKGHAILLEALAKMQDTPWTLTLVNPETPYAGILRSRAEVLGISDRIIWKTNRFYSRDEVREFFRTHDISILPSLGEAIGTVIPESMACGCATLTSDTVGANVYVKDGVTGVICATGDANDLAAKLTHMLRNDAFKHMGIRAAERMHTEFSSARLQARFRDAITSLCH
jgi:GalNAc-alpha-(1->4)-GalNAc-alpha-(1->3)-diNAcBac-PP-undecaprenol alpha-1,4-N-acetyl-D-galactosaminyltransferase